MESKPLQEELVKIAAAASDYASCVILLSLECMFGAQDVPMEDTWNTLCSGLEV
jgi:hypothetical protein